MTTPMDRMKSDYLTMEEIIAKLRAEGLENYLKFKSNGAYEYFESENCDGPMLGHQNAKCRHSEEYEEETIEEFKTWLDTIPELSRLLQVRAMEKANRLEERRAEIIDFVIRDATEAGETRQPEDRDELIPEILGLGRFLEIGETYRAERIAKRQVGIMDRVIRDATEARGATQQDDQDEQSALPPTETPSTNYATNNRRSRIDDWRSRPQSRGDRRSESRSGYSRTASRGRNLHGSSQVGGRSSSRPTIRQEQGGNRIRSRSGDRSSKNGTKEKERSADKPKSDPTEEVEGLEEEVKEIKESIGGMPRIE